MNNQEEMQLEPANEKPVDRPQIEPSTCSGWYYALSKINVALPTVRKLAERELQRQTEWLQSL